MTTNPPKMPNQIKILTIFYALLGLYNLWIAFQGLSSDLGVWYLVSEPLTHEWLRLAIPTELGLNLAIAVAAFLQLLTVPLILTRKPFSVKLALYVFVSIALLNLVAGALYASAPAETELTSAMLQCFGLGIFQIILVSYFWRDLNKPEIKSYFSPFPTHSQHIVQSNVEVETEQQQNQKFYCRYCGSENKKDAVYCESCGKNLSG